MNKKTSKVRFLALSAVIAALYAVLTYAAAAMNLAFGAVQFLSLIHISEPTRPY